MDILDRLALASRKYERMRVPVTGNSTFSLVQVMDSIGTRAILELTALGGNRPIKTVRPDPIRKIKVSLLDDGIAAIHSGASDRYEVYRTAPSGDAANVKLVALSASGEKVGEIRLVLGRRSYDHYFRDDPIFEAIRQHEAKPG